MADAAHRRPKRSPPGMIQPIIPKGGLEREESALPVARHPRINRADQNNTERQQDDLSCFQRVLRTLSRLDYGRVVQVIHHTRDIDLQFYLGLIAWGAFFEVDMYGGRSAYERKKLNNFDSQ